jgi:hypothetical protein
MNQLFWGSTIYGNPQWCCEVGKISLKNMGNPSSGLSKEDPSWEVAREFHTSGRTKCRRATWEFLSICG